jgi:hypothetical protein
MSTRQKTNIGWWVSISVVLIALPIIIGDEGWMTSWGGYLGAVISSAIAFVILYIQRRDNEKQNEDNRKLQLNILIYQQERARLDNLQRMFTEFINLNGFNDLLDIARHIENGHTHEAMNDLRIPFDKGANAIAMFSMEFMLVDDVGCRSSGASANFQRSPRITWLRIMKMVVMLNQNMSISFSDTHI